MTAAEEKLCKIKGVLHRPNCGNAYQNLLDVVIYLDKNNGEATTKTMKTLRMILDQLGSIDDLLQRGR